MPVLNAYQHRYSNSVAGPSRYLKYLTKKYLKKKQIRDWLHVIANGPTNYDLRYFNINNEEQEEDDEDA